MQEPSTNKHLSELKNEIDFKELFQVLFKGKWIILSVTFFAMIIGVTYSLKLPNIYESKSLLVPVNTSTNISGVAGGYSILSGLAGIRLPSGSDAGNTAEAIEKIGSLSFFKINIMPNIHLPDLMAVKHWNSETNSLTYDDRIFDEKSSRWIGHDSSVGELMPSTQESFNVFKLRHLNLSEDKTTGFISLSIKHQSPFLAKQWTELVVNEINSFYRQKDKSESEKAVSYLNKQISETSFSEIKQALAQLIQAETKKLAIVEAKEYYVFDYIDPPAIMEKKSEPNRAMIFILSVLLGGMLSILLVLARYYTLGKNFNEPNNL